jgi:hypothetical protein
MQRLTRRLSWIFLARFLLVCRPRQAAQPLAGGTGDDERDLRLTVVSGDCSVAALCERGQPGMQQ